MLNISGLREGYVIDHIQAGGAMDIYEYLDLENYDGTVAVIKNATSKKMGRKDIIKIEGKLDSIDLSVLGAIDKNITVNVIQNEKIVDKKQLELPMFVTNVFTCSNPRCISTIEQGIVQKFKLTDRENSIYRCVYCESKFRGRRLKK